MTDERLCATCSHTSHSGLPCSAYTSGLRSCPCSGESQAAPSTDEEEARWERGEESPDLVVWRAVGREVLPYVEMPKSLEAAIRAPLEEERDRWRRMAGGAFVLGQELDLANARAEAAEERIRDLQRWAEIDHANLAAAEERIRELEAAVRELDTDRAPTVALAHETYNRMVVAEAENERLREAIIWMSGSAEFGPGQPAHEHWVEIRDTLLFPPSSTEGTKEVEG